jgi:hypothetical protein
MISFDTMYIPKFGALEMKTNEANDSVESSSSGDESIRFRELAVKEGIYEILHDSTIFTDCSSKDSFLCHHPVNLTFLHETDLVLGVKLGEGGFSNVKVCNPSSSNHFRGSSVVCERKKEYAIKYLKRNESKDSNRHIYGTIDLVKESL